MKTNSVISIGRSYYACLLAFAMLLSASSYAAPSNDLCVNAIPVTCGSATPGTTIDGTVESLPPCGNALPGGNINVWYSFSGNGTYVTASLCGAADFDAQISVWTGSCGSLTCVFDLGLQTFFCIDPEITFYAAAGTQYYISVGTFFDDPGNFTLGISCTIAPNDDCANATPISCGQTLTGSTAIATIDAVPACTTATTAPGVWYSFVGTGKYTSVNTSNPATNYTSQISVYGGNCGALTCLGVKDFFAVNGTTYYIYVHGSGTPDFIGINKGDFALTVNCLTEFCGIGTTPILGQTSSEDTITTTGMPGLFVYDVAAKVHFQQTDCNGRIGIAMRHPITTNPLRGLRNITSCGPTCTLNFEGIFDQDVPISVPLVCNAVGYEIIRPSTGSAFSVYFGQPANRDWILFANDISSVPEGNPVGVVQNWCIEVGIGQCGTNAQCNDGDVCTSNTCANGTCVYPPVCDDDDPCTVLTCDGFGGCIITPTDCNDDNVCTLDDCDGVGGCVYIQATCDDGNSCTVDACTPGACSNTPFVCSDGNDCTTEVCDGLGGCSYPPVDCNDDDACNGVETCNPGSGCVAGIPLDCNDDDACNGVETCNPASGCVAGTPLECNDNISCTIDGCDPETGCTYTPGSISVTISQSSISGNFCQGSEIHLTANSATAISYSWSTGATSQNIVAAPGTSYAVTASDVNGCNGTASITTTAQSTDSLSAYTVLALNSVTMSKSQVLSGGVGAKNTSSGIVKLNNASMVTAPNTFVKAKSITLSGGSAATVQILAPSNTPLPVFLTNPNGGSNFSVPSNSVVTLTGSIYSNLTIGKNSTVTFTSPDLYTKDFTTGDNVKLIFAPCTKVRVKGKLLAGKINIINQANEDVIFYVVTSAEVRAGTNFKADIYVRDGKLYTPAASLAVPTVMTGLFIAKDVDSRYYTYWHWNPGCGSCPASKMAENALALVEDDNIFMNAYPNPFSDKLNIEFTLAEDARVKLEIFNLAGQRLAILFDGNVKMAELQKVEYSTETVSDGMVIYRLLTDKGAYFGKAVQVK